MPTKDLEITLAESPSRCFQCFRPSVDCFCDSIPKINNRTRITILQHARERKHPFNTARIVKQALRSSDLIHGNRARLSQIPIELTANSGLLYPSADSKPFDRLPINQRPDHLILIDGTWAQAKTMLRDLPQLHSIPHYRLAPTKPGNYRIRLEPDDHSLSTLEATVAALKSLEPETPDLDRLLSVFDQMVDRQLAHPQAIGKYENGPRDGRTFNSPKALLADENKIVVAYGEATYRDSNPNASNTNKCDAPRRPVVWMAKRLGGQELFNEYLSSNVEMTSTFLDHLRLGKSTFENAVSDNVFTQRWNSFVNPDDTIVVFNQKSIQLLKNVVGNVGDWVSLKSINFLERGMELSRYFEQNGIVADEFGPEYGRAGHRLANMLALVRFFKRR